MAKQAGLSLFDLIDEQVAHEAIAAGAECIHIDEATRTVWPGETFERLTATCKVCKRIRGRAGDETRSSRTATGSRSFARS
jgi:hypothetical protein